MRNFPVRRNWRLTSLPAASSASAEIVADDIARDTSGVIVYKYKYHGDLRCKNLVNEVNFSAALFDPSFPIRGPVP